MIGSQFPEIWGGVECSMLRAGPTQRNQLVETGHYHRPSDIELIAETGIKRIRYPLLWDSICGHPGRFDWAWSDARLRRLRDLNIRIIGGFIHHGPGHRKVHFLDPDFQKLFGEYAEAIARRYPWVDAFTPINEPLTTARFSGLYGLWYPHGTDEATFLRLTVAQCRAIQTAMRAIRKVNPLARLIQTEDVGKTFSTPELSYQAEYENGRRWLALDLLEGGVNRSHPFYDRLIKAGVNENHLAGLVDAPCPPDTIGIDYYLTSDRFLDHRLEQFSLETKGGNGIDEYVDVAALRADVPVENVGRLPRMIETWERYHRTIAITEVHNGCTRDEQLRWLMDGWSDACAARGLGIDVCAVSAWSFFGAVDWVSLLTRKDGIYESGVFDARCSPPRPTVLAQALASLARHNMFDHPVLDRPGWWKPEVQTDSRRGILISARNSILEDCCRSRRLSFTRLEGTAADFTETKDSQAWAIIGESGGTFMGEYRDGGRLLLRADAGSNRTHVANVFLDLLIDGVRENVTLARVGSANQYEYSVGTPGARTVSRAV